MNVLITGNAGSGKTSVCEALQQRGYTVYDADEGFGHWIHKNSGQTCTSRPASNRKDYYWVWSIDKIGRLLRETEDNTVFFCGLATNQAQLYKNFHKIVMLNCDLETIKHRLRNRRNNPFGKRLGDLDWVRQTHNSLQPELRKADAIDVDSTLPLDKVVDKILEEVEVHGL
jgi:dephospho-CoA kinase